MNLKTVYFAAFLILCLAPIRVLAETRQQISVRVVDERGKPVEGAEVQARYLATVRQGAEEYRVPMELAPPQTTDANGQCKMVPHEVSWSLAAIEAHRVEMTTDEAMKLYDDAPTDPSKREAFEREIEDRLQRYSTAYRQLTPDVDANQEITLKMAKAIKVTGRVQVGGSPLAKAFVTISSPKTEIDQLFPRSSPNLTDQTGRFNFYSIPGKLDLARIVVERASGNRVLNLTDVPSKPTPAGLMFEIDTDASDYVLK
ncbi:MAG: hypothetical protein AAFV88_25855 [Planctomycetota bacterium]